MHRTKTALLIAGVLAGAVASAFALANAPGSSGEPPGAFAALPPVPTPKPNGLGSLTGVYDALVAPYVPEASEDSAGPDTCSDAVDNGGDTLADAADPDCRDKNTGLFHCIARLDHASGTNAVEATAQCYVDTPGLALGSALPERADLLPGPPPPPPYVSRAPTKAQGSYNPGADVLTLAGCFANVGGSLGPNVIVQATIVEAKASLPDLQGTVLIHANEAGFRCNANAPAGPAPDPAPLNLTRVASERDFDGDGCTDVQELDKPEPLSTCGDDPYNPYDSDLSFDSVGNIFVTTVQADYDEAAGALIPGAYLQCATDTDHDQATNALSMRLICYIDNSVVTVNPETVPGRVTTNDSDGLGDEDDLCPPAPASQCGDGLAGSPPPPPFSDVDPLHAVLAGSYEEQNDQLLIFGCFQGLENEALGPSIYTSATIDSHTGLGLVRIWLRQNPTNCKQGAPEHTKGSETGLYGPRQIDCGEPPDEQHPQPCRAELVEQSPRDPKGSAWDTDLDGCTDRQELRASPGQGGLRDPYNPWDFMDMWVNQQRDRRVNIIDIGALVNRIGSIGNPNANPLDPPANLTGYHVSADRGAPLIGSNLWNLNSPDGRTNIVEIGETVAQFAHTCTS